MDVLKESKTGKDYSLSFTLKEILQYLPKEDWLKEYEIDFMIEQYNFKYVIEITPNKPLSNSDETITKVNYEINKAKFEVKNYKIAKWNEDITLKISLQERITTPFSVEDHGWSYENSIVWDNLEINTQKGFKTIVHGIEIFFDCAIIRQDAYKSPKKVKTNKDVSSHQHFIMYDTIKLKTPRYEEIVDDNIVECFFISGLSHTSVQINKSDKYIAQCRHEECSINCVSYTPDIVMSFEKGRKDKIEPNEFTSKLCFPTGIKICSGNIGKLKKKYLINSMTTTSGYRLYLHSWLFFVDFSIEEFEQFFPNVKIDKNIKNVKLPFMFTLISIYGQFQNFKQILWDLFYSFVTSDGDTDSFDNTWIHLIYEVPLPPDNTSINLYLQHKHTTIYSDIYNNFPYMEYTDQQIRKILTKHLSVANIVAIFLLIWSEHKIIFLASSYKYLSKIINIFTDLLYPFKWSSTWIPNITEDSIRYIQSFIPYIMGISYEIYANVDSSVLGSEGDIVIIDIEKDTINYGNTTIKSPITLSLISGFEAGEKQIREVFFEGIISWFTNYEWYLSTVNGINLFNQTCFVLSKDRQYRKFYNDISMSQQFSQFIQYCNYDDFLFFNSKCNGENTMFNYFDYSNSDYLNLTLYPFHLPIKKDIDNIPIIIKDYYNALTIPEEKEWNFCLPSDAYIRLKLIMQNNIPTTMRKYLWHLNMYWSMDSHGFDMSWRSNTNDSNSETGKSMNTNHNSLQTNKDTNYNNYHEHFVTESDTPSNLYNSPNNKEWLSSFHKSRRHSHQLSFYNNNSNINASRAPYRQKKSWINILLNTSDVKWFEKHYEQFVELLRDYMSSTLINTKKAIGFSVSDFSWFFIHFSLRKEFSYILYQDKFKNGWEHELTKVSFEDWSRIVFYSLLNSRDSKEEFETWRWITKSIFCYFIYVDSKETGKTKYYLYEQIMRHGLIFDYWWDQRFWYYLYDEENIEYPWEMEDNKKEIIEYMTKWEINERFLRYCKEEVLIAWDHF